MIIPLGFLLTLVALVAAWSTFSTAGVASIWDGYAGKLRIGTSRA